MWDLLVSLDGASAKSNYYCLGSLNKLRRCLGSHSFLNCFLEKRGDFSVPSIEAWEVYLHGEYL